MQLAAVWRIPIGAATGLTLAGGPVGEPALGPVAFRHRASAAGNPTAPLGHHTLDSTHIAFGVIVVAIDRGPFAIEGSVFNGREPDENRWDFDLGRLDSFSGRVWYRPTENWEIQVSSGRLTSPEQLEPGNMVRSTASASWTRKNGLSIASVAAGLGRNDTDHGARQAFFVEGSRQSGMNTFYSRLEAVQVETGILRTDSVSNKGADGRNPVLAFTAGGIRHLVDWRRFEGGLGADMTLYGVPDSLRATHGAHPVSFHLFFRLRASAGGMGRVSNMRMSQPMGEPRMAMPMNHEMH